MLTKPLSLRQVPLSLTAKQKIILTLIAVVLVSIPLWLGLQKVQSAPVAFAIAPAPTPTPIVVIDAPDEVLIGEDFQFAVTFKNTVAMGYGPYIELYLPAKGADSNSPDSFNINQKCDGISFVSAATSFANPPTVALPPTYDSLLSTNSANLKCPNFYTLPFAGMTPASPPSGDYQLVVIELPFGSFDPSQPDIVANVTAHLSDFADEGTPLTIYARGGFRYGSNAMDDQPGDPLLESNLASDQTTPRVLKLKKKYLGPEDETATGPNFPHQYQVTADIADHQTINNLVITDNLPGNLQFAGNVQVTIQGHNANPVATCPTNPGPYDVVISTPPTSGSPGGTLSVKLCSAILGSLAPDDVLITFDFFIPDKDDHNQDILANDCSNSPVPVKNDILATGDWDPLDPRDPNPSDPPGTTIPVTSDLTKVDHLLQAKCIAIQKTVAQRPPNTGGPGLTPGDTLRYELNFQISDYKTMAKISISDLLSDGQLVVGTPTLTVLGDQFGSYTNISFNSTTFSATPDPNITCPNPGGIKGGTVLNFQVSSALAAAAGSGGPPRHQIGILTGGYAAGPPSSVPAKGQIVFYAQIQDKFKYQVPPNNPKEFVDKDDPLNNCVSIDALVLRSEVATTVPSVSLGNTADSSGTQVRIAKDIPKKSVYAVKRGTSLICGPTTTPCLNLPGTPQDVHPGDNVTFRIEYAIPSGDAEALTIDDWLPLPVFDVTTGAWPAIVPGCPNLSPHLPSSGNACRLLPTQVVPGHTLAPPLSLFPGTANNLLFTYGTVNNPANTSKKADLLFTVTVTTQPFADGLFLTNEARENESNTFGPVPSQVTIAQVNLREPHLRIRKGVIATNNPNAQFTQPASPQTIPPTALPPPNAALSLTGMSGIVNTSAMVSSNDLATGLLDSNLPGGVDANDLVTFAITIENLGGHAAYDVKVEDIIPHDSNGNPTCFTILPNTIKVKRGTGATVNPLLYNIVPPVPTTTGFTITSTLNLPIPINAYDPTSGKNIVVITFQAKLLPNVMPGCCDNKAEIKHYASQLNGPDFVTAGFTPPFSDAATVCVKPTLTKSLVATSELHTAGSDVTIGEIARYRLAVVVPEGGVLTNFQVTDVLPAGMKFLSGSARLAFISNGPGISHPSFLPLLGVPWNVSGNENTLPGLTFNSSQTVTPTGGAACGAPITFNLGNIQNNDNDFDLEYVVIEFNALVCNVAGNQSGTTLPNTFSVSVGGNQIATSNQLNVVVVEPHLTMTKTVAPNPALSGQTLTYTIQYTNNGTADAFDVVLQDTLPSGLTLGTVTAGCPVTTTSNVITMTCSQVPKAPSPGSTVIVTYQAVANPATCPVTLNNGATLTWTSLPGPSGTTVNPTGSGTPGNSGAIDGERDGVTPLLTLNNYAATASVPVKIDCPCCLVMSNEMLACNQNGSFNYTFTLTNLSGATVAGVNFSPPAGVTITPSSIAIPPLANGASTNVTVTIGGPAAVSGATVCFDVGIGGPAAPSCRVHHCVTLPACQASACATPPPSMVSWWPLDETSGNTVVDIAGGHNGTTSANIGSDPLSAMPPKVGNALLFVNSKATVAGGPYNFGTGNFSIDAWVRGPVSNAALGIVDKLDMSNPIPTGFAFFIRSGSVRLVMGNGTTGPATFMSPATFTYGTWQHVAVTVQRVGVGSPIGRFYLNGALVSTFVPPLTSVNNGASLLLGTHRLNVGCTSCEVSLDEIEIFNDVVPASDINSIFQADKNGKCKLPDLTIQKKVQCSPPPTKCQIFLTIGNNGLGSFNGILTVQDLVTPPPSPGLSWAGSSTPPGWSCSIGPSDTISCASNSSVPLPPGQSTTFSVSVNVPVGHFKNCASVKGYTQFPYNSTTLIQEANSNNNQDCVPMP